MFLVGIEVAAAIPDWAVIYQVDWGLSKCCQEIGKSFSDRLTLVVLNIFQEMQKYNFFKVRCMFHKIYSMFHKTCI